MRYDSLENIISFLLSFLFFFIIFIESTYFSFSLHAFLMREILMLSLLMPHIIHILVFAFRHIFLLPYFLSFSFLRRQKDDYFPLFFFSFSFSSFFFRSINSAYSMIIVRFRMPLPLLLEMPHEMSSSSLFTPYSHCRLHVAFMPSFFLFMLLAFSCLFFIFFFTFSCFIDERYFHYIFLLFF